MTLLYPRRLQYRPFHSLPSQRSLPSQLKIHPSPARHPRRTDCEHGHDNRNQLSRSRLHVEKEENIRLTSPVLQKRFPRMLLGDYLETKWKTCFALDRSPTKSARPWVSHLEEGDAGLCDAGTQDKRVYHPCSREAPRIHLFPVLPSSRVFLFINGGRPIRLDLQELA
ncbi:MAG: hypothetical protein ACUVV5_02230 [Candidatus Aminicenantales bacterium]